MHVLFRRIVWALQFSWLALLLNGIGSAPLLASDLSTAQQAALEVLDSDTALKVVELGNKAMAWRTAVDMAVAAAKSAGEDIDAAEGAPDKVVTAVVTAAEDLDAAVNGIPQLKVLLDYERRFAPALAELKRAEAEQNSRAIAAKRMLQELQATINQIEQLSGPSQYIKGFVEGKLREWMQKPLPVDDEESLVFRVVPPPKGTPLFSSKSKLAVEIEYMPQDLVVQATGLYFRYEPGKELPVPVIDGLRMEVDYKSTVLSKLRSLGEEITDELDLPIKVTLKDKPDFARGMGGLRGGIRFDVTIGIMGEETVKVEARDLVLYPGNRVDWKDGVLKLDMPFQPPVPIGTTPFGFWTMGGMFGPKDKTVGFSTKISTLATPPTTVSLAVEAKTQIPIKSIEIAGQLEVATVPLMTTEGKIDFSKGTIEGSFKGNDTPLKQIMFAQGKFHLARERFVADGRMEIFGQSFADMHCEINLQTGESLLLANSDFELFGVDTAGTLEGHIDAGFKRVQLSCELNVEVDGIKPYGSLPVSVSVSMDSDDEMPILVEVKTFSPDLDVTIHVPTLAECTMPNLKKWIGDSGAKAYHRLLKSLAEGDEQTRKLGAKMDKQTRDFVDEHFGVTWKTGIPELDKLGGELSKQFKNTGGAWHDLTESVGGAAGKANQAIQDVAKDPSKVLNPTKWGL